MDTMSFVLGQNISHYRQQLISEADPEKRKILVKLLADANAELATAKPGVVRGDGREI